MVTPTRRRVLGLAGVLSLGGLAGCAGWTDDGPEPYQFVSITINNNTNERQTVELVVVENERLVYGASPTVSASGNSDGQSERELSGYPTEPGTYSFYVRLDENGTTEWKRFRPDDIAVPCLKMILDIEPTDDGPATLGVKKDIDGDSCVTPQ